MEENNRKGPGVFYAVVGVATLVVAIIGATFAYFSASNTDNSITGGTATAGGITIAVDSLTETGADMVPLNLVDETTSKIQFTDAMQGLCVDDNQNHVCDIYKITVTNNSTTATIDVRGSLQITSESTNLRWQLINLESDTAVATATEYSTAKFANGIAAGTAGQIVREGIHATLGTDADGSARQTLAKTATGTYYVIIWLEETGAPQENDDAGKGFTGLVTFNAVDAAGNSSGVTASFRQA